MELLRLRLHMHDTTQLLVLFCWQEKFKSKLKYYFIKYVNSGADCFRCRFGQRRTTSLWAQFSPHSFSVSHFLPNFFPISTNQCALASLSENVQKYGSSPHATWCSGIGHWIKIFISVSSVCWTGRLDEELCARQRIVIVNGLPKQTLKRFGNVLKCHTPSLSPLLFVYLIIC